MKDKIVHQGQHAYVTTKLLEFARELRDQQTDAESLLWAVLRNRRFGGHKFRRQDPVDPYIVDFVCLEFLA